MAETPQVKSRRESQIERLRKKYPEKKFEDDEEIYGQIYDDYDEYDKELEGYRGREKQLSDMFAADPRSAQFLTDMHRGEDPVLGLVRNFGVEIKDVLDDPEMQDKIAEANKEFVERTAKSKKLDEEYETNMDATLETLRKFQEERGMSDEDVDKIVDFLLTIVRDGVMGKFSVETLDLACKAMNYDMDVAAAGEEGEVAGRNAKISEKLRRGAKGDGTAPLGGKHGEGNPSAARKNQSIFDLAAEAQ
ncbi:MAG: App1 family protein [Bacteroidales bacterium]|nr:App1 family protein [Bacteroidales bacterium]